MWSKVVIVLLMLLVWYQYAEIKGVKMMEVPNVLVAGSQSMVPARYPVRVVSLPRAIARAPTDF